MAHTGPGALPEIKSGDRAGRSWPRSLRKTGLYRLSAVRIIGSACLSFMALWLFVFDLAVVRGGSMEPTLRTNQPVLILRCAYGLRVPWTDAYLIRWSLPAVNDIVVLTRQGNEAYGSVKRVFETGPAFLSIRQGVVVGRGGSLSLAEDSPLRLQNHLYVGPGKVFLAGDNQLVSLDSRVYGSVDRDQIRGKVLEFAKLP